jgi:hypothetical protein
VSIAKENINIMSMAISAEKAAANENEIIACRK